MTRRRRLAALAGAVVAALTLIAGPAAFAAEPDPLATGPHAVNKVEYEAGTLLLNLPTAGQTTAVPMRGSITYPSGAGLAKIIVFVHGRHAVCIGSPSGSPYICGDETSADGTPIETDIRSYGGYDYMAANLASHGYAVMSVEANVTNFDNNYPDAGANARSQIIYASLGLLYRWNNGAGPVVAGDPDHTVGTKLVGKLDFTDGIGLMGHSRGGDAVTDFIAYNRNLPGNQRKYVLDGVLALAPTHYSLNKTPTGANYATLLPACDGDVSTLQGTRFFENAKYAAGNATTAKIQWYVEGTDHNFFNTVWTDDDFSNTTDPACSRQTPTSKRLSAGDQRKVGIALMNSFLRRYVGDETQFDPIMTGQLTLPASTGLTTGVGVADEVKTSYIGPAASRLDVLRPESTQDPATNPPAAGDPNATTVDAQGGAITTEGLTAFEVCDPAGAPQRGQPVQQTAYPFCPGVSPLPAGASSAGNRSIGTQFLVTWDGPATIDAALGQPDATKDVSRFGVLSLRAANIRWDVRNAPGDGFTPGASQDFDVTLIDADGRRATTNAAAWGKSLQPSLGTRFQHVTLNGIRIPLSAFAGRVDLTKVASVELGFGARTATGAIQLSDVMFQENAPTGGWASPAGDGTTPPVITTPVVGAPDGPESPVPGPIIDTPVETVAPSTTPTAEACADGTAPSSRLTRLALTRTGVRIAGIALDEGCAGGTGAAAGAIQGTLVEISRGAGRSCRFVTAKGRLSAARACDEPIVLFAQGTASWSVTLSGAKLPKGVYAVKVTTYDGSGNATALKTRRVRIA